MIVFVFSATVEQGDWTLVFRAQSGVGEPTWESWNNTGVYNDNPVPQDFPLACLRLTNYSTCDRHFRSRILDNWPSIKEVGSFEIILFGQNFMNYM